MSSFQRQDLHLYNSFFFLHDFIYYSSSSFMIFNRRKWKNKKNTYSSFSMCESVNPLILKCHCEWKIVVKVVATTKLVNGILFIPFANGTSEWLQKKRLISNKCQLNYSKYGKTSTRQKKHDSKCLISQHLYSLNVHSNIYY